MQLFKFCDTNVRDSKFKVKSESSNNLKKVRKEPVSSIRKGYFK